LRIVVVARIGKAVLACSAATALLAAGCGSGQPQSNATPVAVKVTNFAIAAPATLRSGRTTFVIDGLGPTMHEVIVARTDLAADALPLDAAGNVDSETARPDFTFVAEAEGIDIGARHRLTVTLNPGTYALYCNMDGHYQAGMATRVAVSAA
jgi:uncharacterized cupredoxin-like copper-binding protein